MPQSDAIYSLSVSRERRGQPGSAGERWQRELAVPARPRENGLGFHVEKRLHTAALALPRLLGEAAKIPAADGSTGLIPRISGAFEMFSLLLLSLSLCCVPLTGKGVKNKAVLLSRRKTLI